MLTHLHTEDQTRKVSSRSTVRAGWDVTLGVEESKPPHPRRLARGPPENDITKRKIYRVQGLGLLLLPPTLNRRRDISKSQTNCW